MLDITVNDLDFTNIRIKDVNGEFKEYDIQEELQINEHNLQQEIKLQPSKYIYWSSILEQVRAYLESSELQEEHTRAHLYESAREDLIASGSARPTKDQIDAWLLRQEDYMAAKEQVATYKKYVKQLNYVVKSLEQRHSMLVQLSALSRDQLEYERNIKSV